MNKENFTAIILARGGSKAIKLKNLIKLMENHFCIGPLKVVLNQRK